MNPTNEEILSCSDKEIIKKELEGKYPGAIDCVKKLLGLIGDNPEREGLKDTPFRVVKSWLEIYSGYSDDERKLNTFFEEDIGVQTDEIVMCKNISFYSVCEHHMLPFHGVCHIGYLPDRRVIGLSKLVRLVDMYSRRLQIQEKLCSQIANKLVELLKPQGVGVIIEAQHLCMTSRGVKNATSTMMTSAMRGKFKNQPQTRNEFLSLIK
jgi:GTP cyclohydrolase I